MIFYILLKFIPAIAVTASLLSLCYMKLRPMQLKARVERSERKYARIPQYRDFFKRIYTPSFLISWAVIALVFVTSVAFDVHRATYDMRVAALYVSIILVAAIISSAIYIWLSNPDLKSRKTE